MDNSLDELAMRPQCGFWSDVVDNLLYEDDQWRKFDLIQKIAANIWGKLMSRIARNLDG